MKIKMKKSGKFLFFSQAIKLDVTSNYRNFYPLILFNFSGGPLIYCELILIMIFQTNCQFHLPWQVS